MAKDQRLTRLMGRPLALADLALFEAYVRRLSATLPQTIQGTTFVSVVVRRDGSFPEGYCLQGTTQDGRITKLPAALIITALEQGVIDPIPRARDAPLE